MCCSRVPLAPLAGYTGNVLSESNSASSSPEFGYALKLPGWQAGQGSLPDTAATPTSSTSPGSPGSKQNRRKQTLSWKKPKMRDTWSE